MLNDHDLAALLAGTGVSKPGSVATDNATIWLALALIHGLLLMSMLSVFLRH